MSAVQAWTSVGLPRSQLVLGVPGYGHSFFVNESVALTDQGEMVAYPPFEPEQPRGDSADDPPAVDICGATTGWGGVFNFWGLVESKFLDESGQPFLGIYYRYDECSQTVRFMYNLSSSAVGLTKDMHAIDQPYVYNATSQVMVSFDNARSLEAKGEFIKNYGLGGYAMWEAASDYHDILIDSIREGGGY